MFNQSKNKESKPTMATFYLFLIAWWQSKLRYEFDILNSRPTKRMIRFSFQPRLTTSLFNDALLAY